MVVDCVSGSEGSDPVSASPATAPHRYPILGVLTYLWWLLTGVVLGVGLVAAFALGPLLVIAAVAAAAAGAVVPSLRGRHAWLTVWAGIGVAPAYVAWLNREGPGIICRQSADGVQSCTEEYNPWGFAALAVLLVLGSVVGLFVLARASSGPKGT